MNVHVGRCDVSREMSAKKLFDSPHELDVDKIRENALKLVFHLNTLGEKDEVIDIEAKH